ncbi:MAG: family 1 glycosylhydrolase, partial [Candidatus Liptonbacteria bacterium]|nr:family 1 glycosylhydrolase [Candidatus Liptonbacteria bacterium]
MNKQFFWGAARPTKMGEARPEYSRHFFWGAATSAHQVEGGNRNDWTEWEKSESRIKNLESRIHTPNFKKQFPEHILEKWPAPADLENYISGRACDHYNRFREDFDIAKSLGHNAHRFSIEWSRVEPEEGKFDEKEIEHYKEVIRALHERGLEPFVTLWHWTLPLWLSKKGGVIHNRFPEYFSRFAKLLGESFKNDVTFWVTLNEPEVCAGASYFAGIWPPGKRNLFLYYRAVTRLIQAHAAAYRTLKKINPAFLVGAVNDLTFFESAGGPVNSFLKWAAGKVWNFYFLNHVRRSTDFIGLNYYFHSRINYWFNMNKNEEVSDMGWEIYPEGIFSILTDLSDGIPIYITECGIATSNDDRRIRFLMRYLQEVYRSIKAGVNVKGFFYW